MAGRADEHVATRRYLHLTADGRAFIYVPRGRYREVSRREALEEVFEGWEQLLPLPTAAERRAMAERIRCCTVAPSATLERRCRRLAPDS